MSNDSPPAKKPHRLADHLYGEGFDHVHDGEDGADHDDDHDDFGGEDGAPEDNALWVQDNVSLTSVGIDIGSSTSHLVFSKLLLERLDSRYVVTARETSY